jgi:hypothetical protein
VVLNPNTTGSGQIGTMDTTLLQNGAYLGAVERGRHPRRVAEQYRAGDGGGDYKPGRVTATITDLAAPSLDSTCCFLTARYSGYHRWRHSK